DPQEHRRRARARSAQGALGARFVDFDFSDEEKQIKEVAHELLAARSPFAKVREAAEAGDYDPELARELVELGWPGIAVSAEHGGQDLGFVELAVVLEELGYACAATSLTSSATAAAVIEATGSPEQRSRWLPQLSSGEATGAIGMTLEFVKDRKQFGVPVGSFQAVGHRCAQMLLMTESARSAAYFAAWAADADPERLPEAAALAAAAAGTAAKEVTASAIQAHGGIGFTWEADLHWLYKRAQLDAALLGSAPNHP